MLDIDPTLEALIRERADGRGVSIEAYLEQLVETDQSSEGELEALALQGLDSGEPIRVGPNYWGEKHRTLDERLRKGRE